MPTIMTKEEAEYNAKFQEYELARVDFYSGMITPAQFIEKRKAMEAAMAKAYP